MQYAERVLADELAELPAAGNDELVFNLLAAIYELYVGKPFRRQYISGDEREQNDLQRFFQEAKTKEEIRKELSSLQTNDPEEVQIRGKTYKRDNKTIAQLKVLGDFKCQICNTSIVTKDGRS